MNRRVYVSILGLIFLTLSFLMGCGGGSSSTTPVESIAATSGTPQSAPVGTAFAPLIATVTQSGSPVPSPVSGVVVTFTAPATGASGTFANATNTTTATTDANGNAFATFTANGTAGGPYTVTAAATGVSTTASFRLTNTAGAPTEIADLSGGGQSAAVGTAFANPLAGTVVDSDGNPVSGVVVTFAAPGSGASGTFAGTPPSATAAVTTGSNGVATSPTFTANATVGGPYSVTAALPGLPPSAAFSLTNTAVVVETVMATGGTPQSAPDDTAFATPLTATVTAGGSPVSGVTVTFTAPTTGASGTFANGTNTTMAVTNGSGMATSTTFSANGTLGTYTVMATVPGGSGPANFSLTNIVGAPASITATSGTPQSAMIDTAFTAPLVATVLDKGSNPVSGAVVTFMAPASGASGTFANGTNTTMVATNASGVATSTTFSANGTAGAYTVTATVAGVTAPADFSLTNTAGAAASITATSGTPQSAAINTAFAAPLVATVLDKGSNPVRGVTVTFTAPTTGASGTFANGTNTTMVTTNASGTATSTTFSANGTVGGPYTVTATVAGVSTPADFSLTNTAVASSNYSFYVSGLEELNDGPNFYALAGSVTIDSNGNVLGGEQDYNDGFGLLSHEPGGDTITGGTLKVNANTGQGTLTLITNNMSLGVNGTEILGVQFVNTKHALVVQFDGTATSSGSMDAQTLSSTLNDGNYAFTFSGVDTTDSNAIVFGGVFSISASGAKLAGFYDVDDPAFSPPVTRNQAFNGTISTADPFGRGTITGAVLGGIDISLVYYIVGPEVIRIIDVDSINQNTGTGDAGIGSVFGQGAGTFGNTSIGASVFGVESNSYGNLFAAAGMLTTVPAGGTFQGVGDDDEIDNVVSVSGSSISGSYSIASDGYGSLTINAGMGDVSDFGIYMTNPTLNLNDPNNTTSGLGGALIADLDDGDHPIDIGLNGTGVLIPQQQPVEASSFTGDYAFGALDYNELSPTGGWEFDFVGQGSVTNLVLNGTGLVSDPFAFFSTNPFPTGVVFSGTVTPDANNAGRYTIPLAITVGTDPPDAFSVVIYQASGGQLFWLDNDGANSVFLGVIEQQGSLTGIPAVTRGSAKSRLKHRQ